MVCLHTTGFFLYISYIEKDDPVCGLPSPYISIEKVPSAQGHGNCLYIFSNYQYQMCHIEGVLFVDSTADYRTGGILSFYTYHWTKIHIITRSNHILFLTVKRLIRQRHIAKGMVCTR